MYRQLRSNWSLVLTQISAAEIGTITINTPAAKLNKNEDNVLTFEIYSVENERLLTRKNEQIQNVRVKCGNSLTRWTSSSPESRWV